MKLQVQLLLAQLLDDVAWVLVWKVVHTDRYIMEAGNYPLQIVSVIPQGMNSLITDCILSLSLKP